MNSIDLLVVLGSVTQPGRLHRALGDAVERARAAGLDVVVLDLGTVTIGFADGRPLESLTDDTPRVVEAVRAASTIVLASPVYRASITGALKNLLDLLPVEALQGKPVGLVAMGATAHHFLGAASHLRDVCAWFGALVAPTDVYLTSADFADGVPVARVTDDLDALVRSLQLLQHVIVEGESPLGPTPLAARAR